jgi:hypothetical protein
MVMSRGSIQPSRFCATATPPSGVGCFVSIETLAAPSQPNLGLQLQEEFVRVFEVADDR